MGIEEVRRDTLGEFERAELARIESAMDAADRTHRETLGQLLLEVKEKRLWREGYASFEEYVEHRHKITRGYAYVVAGFADVKKDVPEVKNPGQAQFLIPIAPEERRAVYEEARELAGDRPPARSHIEAAAKAARARPKKPGPDATTEEIHEYMRATGVVAEGVEIITERFGDPDAEPLPEPEEPTDEEWLDSLPARKELPPHIRKNFDADALLFRKAEAPLLTFIEWLRKPAAEAKKSTSGHIGAWLDRAYRFFKIEDPSRWRVCPDCDGSGRLKLLGKCPECRGQGYLL